MRNSGNQMRRVTVTPRVIHTVPETISEYGNQVTISGHNAVELESPIIQLRDAIDRLPTDQGRRFNVAMAVASLMTTLMPLPPGWIKPFMVNGQLEDSSLYPELLYEPINGKPQCALSALMSSVERLRVTSDCFVGPDEIETPWTTVDVRFVHRDRHINAYVHAGPIDQARVLPYLLFVVGGVLEFVSNQLGRPSGYLAIATPSLYMLEADSDSIRRLQRHRWPFKMEPMPLISTGLLEDFRKILLEEVLFTDLFELLAPEWRHTVERRWLLNQACVLRSFALRRSNPRSSARAHDTLKDGTLKHVLRQWLVPEGVVSSRTPVMRHGPDSLALEDL